MKVLTERKDLLRALLALVFSASLISGCNGKEPLPTASGADITASESENSEADITASESENSIADITASESENSVAEAELSENSTSSVTTGYDPQAVLRYKELIAANEDEDNIPEDLVMKRVTEYDGDVQTNLYEDGRLIESSTYSSDIKYEYSGDDLIRIHETYGSKDRDGYPNEYDTEIEHGEDQEKRIRTHCRSGRLCSSKVKNYKDGLLYEETEEYDDTKKLCRTYEYDGETLVRQTLQRYEYDGEKLENVYGWIGEYSYDDKGRLIRSKNEETDMDACIETWEYDDAGVLLHYEKTFEGRKSGDEDYEDMDYEYIIDNGYTEISRGYVFDDEGNKTGKIRIKTIEYDEHGREIFRSTMIEGEDEPLMTRVTENTYDDQGRIIKQESVWGNGDIFKVIEYEYKQ